MPVERTELSEGFLERPTARLSFRHRASTSGRWVVFLHGAGMDGHMFDSQIASLPEDVGIVCWDARGHGRSTLSGSFSYGDMCDDLHALVTHLKASSLIVVGQSMGGNLAQTFLELHPEMVERMVLIDCTDNHGPLTCMERLALRSAGMILAVWPWRATVAQSAQACGTQPQTVAYAEDCLRRMGKRRFINVMGFGADCLQPDPSHAIPVPTMAIVGSEDRTGNIAQAMARMAERNPLVSLVVVDGAAHNANMDQPAVVDRELAAFVKAPFTR